MSKKTKEALVKKIARLKIAYDRREKTNPKRFTLMRRMKVLAAQLAALEGEKHENPGNDVVGNNAG